MMRCINFFLIGLTAIFGGRLARGAEGPAVSAPAKETVWEASLGDFSRRNYDQAVEILFRTYEQATGRKLTPG
ncbi:MAG: hypothetical protein KGJ37_01450, partial [Verrucomicrobiota bacterium]|nr:hypothetical protein [Verrucomicrobiota bacterium]